MKQVVTNSQKLNLQKKTIKKLSIANMAQIQGGIRNTNTTAPVSVPPVGTR